jgi:DNA-binding transcriptional ArsR family regulator
MENKKRKIRAGGRMPDKGDTETSNLLVALGHAQRRRILQVMAMKEPMSPRDLSRTLRKPLSNLSYHVRVLADCGAITLVDTRPVRGSIQHFYRVAIEADWARNALGIDGTTLNGGATESSS